MGRRRKPRRSKPNAEVAALAAALADQRIEGGCDDCNAYQTVTTDPVFPNLHRLTVHHDDTCPFLAQLGRDRG